MTLFLIIFLVCVGSLFALVTLAQSTNDGGMPDFTRSVALIAIACYALAAALQIMEILA